LQQWLEGPQASKVFGAYRFSHSAPINAHTRTAVTPNTPGEIKHAMVVALQGHHAATVSGNSIERRGSDPSVVHARGQVEIKLNGFIVRADEADYNEHTGEVEAHGTIKVEPYPSLPK
jgi:lipopolysaccharide assembly outer membrane protein LptD (OstA)